MDRPYGKHLQKELRRPNNVDETINHNLMFIPLTLQYTHIWSFFETIETPVRARMQLPSSKTSEQAKATALNMLVRKTRADPPRNYFALTRSFLDC